MYGSRLPVPCGPRIPELHDERAGLSYRWCRARVETGRRARSSGCRPGTHRSAPGMTSTGSAAACRVLAVVVAAAAADATITLITTTPTASGHPTRHAAAALDLRCLGRGLATPRDEQGCRGADRDDRGAEVEGRGDAVDEAVGGLVAAVVGEDRGQHRDAEDAAELADRVVGARCLTLFVGLDRGEDDVGDGREVHRHPDAGEGEGNDDARVGQRRREDGSDPGEAGRLEGEAGGHDRAAADPVGEQSGDRGDQDRHRRPGQDPKARPAAARRPARSGSTGRAGRSSRTSRRT